MFRLYILFIGAIRLLIPCPIESCAPILICFDLDRTEGETIKESAIDYVGHVEGMVVTIVVVEAEEVVGILEIVATSTEVTSDDSTFDDVGDVEHVVCLDIALALWVYLRHGVQWVCKDAILWR